MYFDNFLKRLNTIVKNTVNITEHSVKTYTNIPEINKNHSSPNNILNRTNLNTPLALVHNFIVLLISILI